MWVESISSSASPIRLAEHLEEKQESFNLEAYLLERGYAREGSHSQPSVGFFSSSHSRKIKIQARPAMSFSLCRRKNKKIGVVTNKCSAIKQALCKKLVSRFKDHQMKDEVFNDNANQGREIRKEDVSVIESERLSSASLSATSESMEEGSHSKLQSSHQSSESAADRRVIQCSIIVEENKQCSPDSVLDKIQASPIYHDGSNRQDEHPFTLSFSLPRRPTENKIFSASLWDLIIRGRREKQGFLRPSYDPCSRSISSKKAMQQTRQLLFDCVRDAVESQDKQGKTGHLMGPEKLGRIICHNMRVWDKYSTYTKKMNKLLQTDLMMSLYPWGNFESLIGEVANQVGDEILEHMKDEMVEEIMNI